MGACAFLRILSRGVRSRRRPSLGFTTTETVVALGIAGVLSAAGLSLVDLHGIDLSVAHQELRGCLEQGFIQARAQGRNVTLVPAGEGGGPGILPVQLPRRVKWGKPAEVPLPPGMDDPVRADTEGQAHPRITITPRRTVTASSWFLHDGRDALCFRLGGHGHLTVLRYRAARHRWERVG